MWHAVDGICRKHACMQHPDGLVVEKVSNNSWLSYQREMQSNRVSELHVHVFVQKTILSTWDSSQYLHDVLGIRFCTGKNEGEKPPLSQLIVLQRSHTAMLLFTHYWRKIMLVAFWLGHNAQLWYLRRLNFKDRVRVRVSIRGLGLGLGLGLA